MKQITLGSTGITSPQNAFGALPIQRDSAETAVRLLRRAFEGGMTFFDTARSYSDSEEKVGIALSDVRRQITLATKTGASTPDEMKRHIETSLSLLKTDYLDIYQFHCANRCYQPGDGTGMYETMEDFKRQGLVRHIGITCHKIGVAEECVRSGLYETMQFPFSYLSGERELALVELCREKNVGFIAMKGLAGGLITNSRAAMAYMTQFDNVLPIWGIQHEQELDEWLSYMDDTPAFDDEIRALIDDDQYELGGDFCRGCGYCLPCPKKIVINQCARMSLMLRRAPSEAWLSDYWKAEMERITECVNCCACMVRCPYELNTPALLRKNYEDYQNVLAGKVRVTND
ncbi:MAG: aldo/keto reductase [Clostridia bacterium]|nr:aldo/keto reductase [Clostridia bacterium]